MKIENMAAKFFSPDGHDIEDPTPEFITSLISGRGADYWEAGSGDAAIRFSDKMAEGEVIFMVREPHGVFVQFIEHESGKEFVLTNGESEDETITIQQNGEPWELPRTFFVPKTVASETIAEFIRSGKRPIDRMWTEF